MNKVVSITNVMLFNSQKKLIEQGLALRLLKQVSTKPRQSLKE